MQHKPTPYANSLFNLVSSCFKLTFFFTKNEFNRNRIFKANIEKCYCEHREQNTKVNFTQNRGEKRKRAQNRSEKNGNKQNEEEKKYW